MKIKAILTAACLASSAVLDAATLNVTTAVQSQPDSASPVIAVLRAGSEAPLPTSKAVSVPAGWSAVDVQGPFEGYVRNRDLTKQLDVKPGSTVYLEPKDVAVVLTTFEAGDKAEITGLHGGWTQVSLQKTIIGYVPSAGSQAPMAISEAPAAPANPASAPTSSPSSAPSPTPAASAPSADGEATLSRLFEGTLATTRSLLSPRRPFDWQLLDSSGKRVAYVDLSKLLLTDQIENYAGHSVVVLGSFRTVKDSTDIVINVEALRLK
jgi:hypothetical protein